MKRAARILTFLIQEKESRFTDATGCPVVVYSRYGYGQSDLRNEIVTGGKQQSPD